MKNAPTPYLTASLLYSHLSCPHRVAMDATGDPAQRDPVSPFVQLLWERGTAHEREVIAGLGVTFTDLSALRGEAKETATREAMARREPLIYAGRLSVHELLGEPDLLRFENGGYAAIDIKSGAGLEGVDEENGEEGRLRKPYAVQIALYTDILLRMDLAAGRYGYIWDVHGVETRYELDEKFGPRSATPWELYLRVRAEALETLRRPAHSRPALCSVCKMCVWHSACFRWLSQAQDLSLVPELGRRAREALVEEFPTLQALAAADPEHYIEGETTPFARVGSSGLRKFQRRAALQVTPGARPYLTGVVEWPARDVELYFDIEADPMRDLVYLHGFLIRERGGPERFRGIFADSVSPGAERDAFAEAMALLRHYPDSLVVHYSAYERTQYRRLRQRYPEVAGEAEIEQLFAAPRAMDLYSIVRGRSIWPTHDHSVKSLAKHCGFAWRDVDPSGAASIEWFERWAEGGEPALRQRLLDYNEDDCRAMRVVLDAMRAFEVRD